MTVGFENTYNERFLKQVARSLYSTYGTKIVDLTVVFPNRRAGLFFVEYLNSEVKAPVFSPEIITIRELFVNLSTERIADPLNLIFRLFKVFKDITDSTETFDEFYLWGEMLLHDFDQVDKYLADPEALFTNIKDLKEIDEHFSQLDDNRKKEISEFWATMTSTSQKSNQKEFAKLWQLLFPVYTQFKQHLQTQNLAYEGMLFRNVSDKTNLKSDSYINKRHFIIVGLNALNGCEKKLFTLLNEQKKIHFFWDYDQYYFDDAQHEAGLFLRENIGLFPSADQIFQTDSFNKPKQIKIIHTSSQVGQAQIASNELRTFATNESDFDDTAVVLCDEELLLPLLSSIPPEIEKINVTMGLPLKFTPLYSLIDQLITLQRKNRIISETLHFHYKSVTDILTNQLVYSMDPALCTEISERIVKKNQVYVPVTDFYPNHFFSTIFSLVPNVSELPDYFLSILHALFLHWEKITTGNFSFNYQEYIYQVYLTINQLKNTLFTEGAKLLNNKEFLNRETFFRLMMQHLNSTSVSFEGEPLAGLQVMGILETRSLDFKNVVLLSMNEGIMPKSSVSGSFIPYHLRRGMGLPTIEDQNAMYAYYFYRLIQRAENITLIYNSGTNGLKSGEKSRFLYQLLLETSHSIIETGIENTIDPILPESISIRKDEKIQSILNTYFNLNRRLSPTALDQYLFCPLSFYFKYIVKMEEEDQVSEEVDARMFGTLFHGVMERIYQPFINKTIEEETIKALLDNDLYVSQLLLSVFRTLFFKSHESTDSSILQGRNLLIFEVIKKMVLQTLEIDLKRVPFVILDVESNVETTVSLFKESRSVKIGGMIDRIDLKNDRVEILDYKTGKTELAIESIADLFDKESKKRSKAAFQILLYCLIYGNRRGNHDAIYPGVFKLKEIFKQENFHFVLKDNANQEVNFADVKTEFEDRLKYLLEEIFNPEIAFSQTTLEDHCKYCPFVSVCGKESSQS